MNKKKIFDIAYRQEYFEGYSIGSNPQMQFSNTNNSQAFIAGFDSGRLDYERMNGPIIEGIPQKIVTSSVLEDFLISGLLGLSVDTNGFTPYQLNVIANWYQSGTEKYDPNQSIYLYEILKMNGIELS
ncbi:MAG TPA: hypothetical protein VN192_01365 [Flavobacterium sp.]|jgi:hypothetical protein|nr:hypothetical protein [Flavobacterium sp.]